MAYNLNRIMSEEEQKNGLIESILEAYKDDNIVECLNLIDKYRLDYEDGEENYEDTHSMTDNNLIVDVINMNKEKTFNFVFWFIDYVAENLLEDSNKIYMFYAFREAVLEGNILLAERFLQAFNYNIHSDFLYDRKFINEVIEEFSDNDEEYNNINVLLFVLNTVFDNEYISRFQNMPYNTNHINQSRSILESKIREHI